jgi:hypothetical protein
LIISDERQSHFAQLLVNKIWEDDLVDYTDEDLAIRMAKRGLAKFVKEFTDIDKKVRTMIATLKRNVPEGSPEWDVMYGKYFEEELRRHGS